MSKPSRQYPGLPIERKRSVVLDLSPIPRSPVSSLSSKYRRGHYNDAPHSPTSPSSIWFARASEDKQGSPLSTPDAEQKFAHTSPLRRHHTEDSFGVQIENIATAGIQNFAQELREEKPQGFWRRAFYAVTVAVPDDSENGNGNGNHAVETADEEPPMETPSARYAHCTVKQTLRDFQTSLEHGLVSSQMAFLHSIHGYNEFSVSSPEHVLLKFAKTIYESPLVLLLCASAVVSSVMGNVDDAVSITIAVLIVLTVGFVQEQRSEKSLEALNKLVPHHCHALRDGQSVRLLANELVPGDIITLTTGDRVPADIRLLVAVDLEIDESSLTGETFSRRKDVAICAFDVGAGGGHEPATLADRTCIGYMGTLVRNGHGTGIVIATGTQTEFGVIFSMMQEVEEKRTPLQLGMDELAKNLSIISFAVIGVICFIGVMQSRSRLEMFTIGVSLAVAAIPEGLPIVTTVTLALGVLRMSKRKAIVKKLHSVEALGSVSVICSDKTGTLTKNEMTVTQVDAVDEVVYIDLSATEKPAGQISPAILKVMEIGCLCNNASLVRNDDGEFMGQSTDIALLNVLDVFGAPDQRSSFTRLSERPFNSEQKYMAVSGTHAPAGTAHLNAQPREMYYIKGSIEAIIDKCKFYYVSDGSTPTLDANTRSAILNKAEATASRGLRVIAMAYGQGSVEQPIASAYPSEKPTEKTNLVFVGFQAMLDPPRKGVADAIGLLQSAGVHVVMITGDAAQTALSIAKELGLRVGPAGSMGTACLTGKAIDQMTKAQLRDRVRGVSVFARTTPRHKMAIVEAFQANGEVVAMTGDGVNDAPALKMADIGVSLGRSGTDVAKEAADVILVDDNFSTILPAVEEGKSIFHNIQNFLSFQLSTAAAALTLITLSTIFGLSNPLNAMQILFINILMDGPPSQSLGVDPVDPAIMRKPPRKKNEPVITQQLLQRVLFSATIIVVGTLFIYRYALSDDHMSRREQTMTFTCFVFLDLISAIQNRGLGCGLTQNKMLITTVSISFLTQLTLVYVPVMQAVFQTEALPFRDLLTLLVLACTSMGLHEARRRYERAVNAAAPHAAEQMA
ncbi:calcium-transporting P [Athelia psychrophila]|uniref:Calcium-transporting ATPase n=1 Tax=Athelia psychrophila TaxID=1759441 RepID=A0A166H158_9AGAM|nr:calcium-transporting P [Fibularhizoctonia sp. CBS 109695]